MVKAPAPMTRERVSVIMPQVLLVPDATFQLTCDARPTEMATELSPAATFTTLPLTLTTKLPVPRFLIEKRRTPATAAMSTGTGAGLDRQVRDSGSQIWVVVV